ncbi:MAG: SusC/RagA family TonB-linked outer membrane protein [Gemmatimonadota bacterium]|nr:SusC/RagA family TonB-linked outer membrane protein [Gemmatimonadota bacterium]
MNLERLSWRGWAASLLLPSLILLFPTLLSAQATVTGTVQDEQGAALVGAQVTIEDQNLGAVTDAQGRYTITDVSTGEIMMTAIYLGFREMKRRVRITSGENVVDFRLTPSPVELDAIVVTGTAGEVHARSLGNAISQIDAGEVLEKSPVVNMAELLQGRTSGAVVLPSSGTAGAGARIRLRGFGSISTSNEPLIYIDGVRVDNDATAGGVDAGGQLPSRFDDLVPEEIESIEIIKGPAAATLYGTEAANGVIQIITKKGRSGDTRWNLRLTGGASTLENQDFPTNFAAIAPDAPLPDGPGVFEVKTLESGARLIGQNPLDEVIDTGYLQDYVLSVNGGLESFTYFLSGNFKRDEGPIPLNEAERIGGRANFRWSADLWDLSVSSSYANNDILLPQNDNNIFGFWGNLLLARPDFIGDRILGVTTKFGEPFTAFQTIAQLETQFTNDRFTGSATANFDPFDWWENRAVFGVDLNAEENFQFFPFEAPTAFFPTGQKENHRQTVFNVSFDYNGTVSFDITEDLTSRSSFGTQIFNENTDIVEAQGEDFPAPGVSTVSAAAITEGFESRTETTTVGLYVQEQIAWQNKLFLTGAVRFDDNSAFGEDFDFETYPKASVSYVISDERWWSGPLDLVNTLKLRSAYGFAGKQPAAFAAERTFTPVAIRGGSATITPAALGDPDLGPERSRELEIGFDAGIWSERIGLAVTYYDKTTDDALIPVTVPPSRGFRQNQLRNVGEIENKGWEISADALVVDTDPVDWAFDVNFTTNDNEVTDLGGEEQLTFGFADATNIIKEGFPVDGLWGRRPTIGPDGEVELTDEKVFQGRSTPEFFGSFGNTITLWDDLQIYALFDWKSDVVIENNNDWFRWAFASSRFRWDPELSDDPRNKTLRALVINGEPLIEDSEFLRFRELSVAWTLPFDWTRKLGARRASVTVAGRNLGLWTDYPGIDPEVNGFGAANIANTDFLTVPPSRRFQATINLTY